MSYCTPPPPCSHPISSAQAVSGDMFCWICDGARQPKPLLRWPGGAVQAYPFRAECLPEYTEFFKWYMGHYGDMVGVALRWTPDGPIMSVNYRPYVVPAEVETLHPVPQLRDYYDPSWSKIKGLKLHDIAVVQFKMPASDLMTKWQLEFKPDTPNHEYSEELDKTIHNFYFASHPNPTPAGDRFRPWAYPEAYDSLRKTNSDDESDISPAK